MASSWSKSTSKPVLKSNWKGDIIAATAVVPGGTTFATADAHQTEAAIRAAEVLVQHVGRAGDPVTVIISGGSTPDHAGTDEFIGIMVKSARTTA